MEKATGSDMVKVSTGANSYVWKTLASFKSWLSLSLSDIASFILPIASGGSNSNTYTAPNGNISPLLYFDGTRFKTVALPADLGFDAVNGVMYTKLVNAANGMTTNGPVYIHKNSIAASSTDGHTVENTTPATSSVPVQISPAQKFRASAWDTLTASAKSHYMRSELITVSGAGTSSRYSFKMDVGSGSFTEVFSISSNGTASVPTAPVKDTDVLRKVDLNSTTTRINSIVAFLNTKLGYTE